MEAKRGAAIISGRQRAEMKRVVSYNGWKSKRKMLVNLWLSIDIDLSFFLLIILTYRLDFLLACYCVCLLHYIQMDDIPPLLFLSFSPLVKTKLMMVVNPLSSTDMRTAFFWGCLRTLEIQLINHDQLINCPSYPRLTACHDIATRHSRSPFTSKKKNPEYYTKRDKKIDVPFCTGSNRFSCFERPIIIIMFTSRYITTMSGMKAPSTTPNIDVFVAHLCYA